MRFTALPVHSFDDATLDLEQLQALLTAPGANVLPFLQLLTAGKIRIAFGTQALTWSGTVGSNAPTVNHGLAATPQVVLATVEANPVGTAVCNVQAFNRNSTSFQLQGVSGAAVTGSATADWIAIG